ncbi:Ubiquitin-like modifier HUB1 [Trichoderma simmonsii]|uniref:Ubiquitin-like modifier HUB1 n=1 Tax=Trichoderma simmonsii TaxID=1491479 RepID=A0A8G0LAY3_9HYPO|nr:Ubiquitin-like modifier HUB1 [Trichoderma simmonsii]
MDSSSRRSRSRSPPRRAPKGSGGFRWKDQSRPSDDNRGSYDSRRDRYGDRDRDRERERDRGRDRDYGDRRRDYRDRSRDRGGRDRYEGRPRSRSPRRHDSKPKDTSDKVKRDDKKEKKDTKAPKAAVGAGQEFIIVHVNDRLGTKSAIPCLPSDTVGQFKLMIAARIGREAGQIMLRRQGERPFKDHITLEDYGISNGVQLDLEVDTGD